MESQGRNRADQGLVERLRSRGGESIVRCIQCGTCTSSCTVNAVESSYNPRRFIQTVLTRDVIPRAEHAWLCATCGICVERCPKNVSPMDIILATRCILFEESDKIPPDRSEALRSVLRYGRALKPTAEIERRRTALGLPKLALGRDDISQIKCALETAGLLNFCRREKGTTRRNH